MTLEPDDGGGQGCVIAMVSKLGPRAARRDKPQAEHQQEYHTGKNQGLEPWKNNFGQPSASLSVCAKKGRAGVPSHARVCA